MITPPPGWKQHFGANLVALHAPDGTGRIRCYERQPLEPLSQAIARVIELDDWSIPHSASIVTAEGEYGAIVRVTGIRAGKAHTHFIGVVFGDDFATLIDTDVIEVTHTSALEATTLDLLVRTSLGLGVRRRRFLYRPPAQWQAIPNALVATWYPPDFPANRVNIVVFPAEPATNDPDQELVAMLANDQARGVVVEGEIARKPIESQSGLAGHHWMFTVRIPDHTPIVHREIVTFDRRPYRYAMRMESYGGTRLVEHQAQFLDVARSALPIPPPGEFRIGSPPSFIASQMFSHWID